MLCRFKNNSNYNKLLIQQTRWLSSVSSGSSGLGFRNLPSDTKARDEQTRGAMRQYLQPTVGESTDGLWMRLRNDLTKDRAKPSRKPVGSFQGNSRKIQNSRLRARRDRTSPEDMLMDDYLGFDPLEHQVDTNGMDEIDTLFARVFADTHGTSDNTLSLLLKAPGGMKGIIPSPRCISELAMTTSPNIVTAPDGSDGFDLGIKAWQVMSKNVYIPDREKEFYSNRLAQMAHEAIEIADQSAAENEEFDVIYHPDFRKGMAGIEAEELEAILAGKSNEDTPEEGLEDDGTDWDVEAVVDEDQL